MREDNPNMNVSSKAKIGFCPFEDEDNHVNEESE